MTLSIASSLENISSCVLQIFSEIGGAAILTVAYSFIIHKINTRFEKKISAKYDAQIETLKTQLDILSHESNTYFDTQFSTYQELCSAFFQLLSAIHWLFPSGLDFAAAQGSNYHNICNDRYRDAQEKYNVAAFLLGGKAAFIPEHEYTLFQEILKLSQEQICTYRFSEPWKADCTPSIDNLRRKGFERTDELNAKWDALLSHLREYLSGLHYKNEKT